MHNTLYIDLLVPRLQLSAPDKPAKGLPSSLRRATLLTLAVTTHNIPEGIAVGTIFEALADATSGISPANAVALTIGLSLHKVVEGAAVALPLVREGMTGKQSFWHGQAAAAIGPGAALLGLMATSSAQPILPYAMGFAASAMIYVAVREIIPETQGSGNPAGMAFMVDYAVVMTQHRFRLVENVTGYSHRAISTGRRGRGRCMNEHRDFPVIITAPTFRYRHVRSGRPQAAIRALVWHAQF